MESDMAQKFFDIRPFQCQRFAIVPIMPELVDSDPVGSLNLQIPQGYFDGCPIAPPRMDIMTVEYIACNLLWIILR
jgi:hypothetical protein